MYLQFSKYFTIFSSALLGADLAVKSVTDLCFNVVSLVDKNQARELLETLQIAKAFLIYALAAMGIITQLGMDLEKMDREIESVIEW